jgi:hypothetical protein
LELQCGSYGLFNHFVNEKTNFFFKTKNYIEIWLCVLVGVVGKLFSELDFIEFISQFSKLKWGKVNETILWDG